MTCPHCGAETPAALSRCLSCSRTLPATSAPARPQDSSEDGALTAYPPARGSGGQAGDAVTDAETGTLPPGFADRSAADDNDALTTGLPPARATSPRSSPPPQTGLSASGRNLTSSGGTDRVIPPHIAEGLTGGFGDEATGAGHGSTPAAQRGPLAIGQSFGSRYHIIRLLGLGGMGAVYQAWDAELGVAVALKVVRPEIAADPEAARDLERRFKRELLLARQVTHKNVVRIHDLGEIDGIKYITMPYVEGNDLSTILTRDGKLPVTRVLRIARTMVAGLQAAHQAGVVHRDLKPANIMIDAEDEAMIMDFGIARSSGGPSETLAAKGSTPHLPRQLQGGHTQETLSGAIVGTVQYMAPEQARGESVDQRADIYAFGLILYDMLVGKRRSAHAQSAVAELQARLLQSPPPVRSIEPGVPPEVDRLVSRCIESDAAKRFPTTADLAAALDRLDDNGKLKPLVRRLTWRMIAAAAVVVLLLVGGAFYTATRLSAPPKKHDPVTVVIADFQNRTNDPTFDHALGQTLRRALESASFITAFDAARVRSAFGVEVPKTFDERAARQFAINQGLGVVLAGSIAPSRAGYQITLHVTQAVTGKVVSDVRRRASSKDQVLETIAQLVSSARTSLGDETSSSAQMLAMRSLSTTSLDVARYYAAALDAQSKGEYEQALQHYTRAVKLDPKFGLAYQGLAAMNSNLGRLQDAEKYARQALQYLDFMTERERFLTRGSYFVMTGDYEQCVREYGELIARYPADVLAYNQRAICLARLRNMKGAADALRKALELVPKSVIHRTNYALLLDYSGDFAGAEREILALPELNARILPGLALAQLGQGHLQEAAATYGKLKATGAWGASFAAAGLGDLAAYQGRFSEAVGVFEEGAAADLRAQNPDAAAMKLTAAAHAHLASGHRRPAAAAAERALQYSTVTPIRFLAARTLIEAGAIPRARTLAAGFASEVTAEAQAYGKILEGGIALAQGDARAATKLLTEANTTLDTWLGHFDLGRAFLALRAFPQADSEFDRCIQRRGEALVLLDEDPTYSYFPIVYYYRGRIREELKTANTAEAYREYLDIRGESTEDPLLPEIRKRRGGSAK